MRTRPTYELTDETIVDDHGRTLHRVRALVDLPRLEVAAGALGGWLERPEVTGGPPYLADEAWVADDARVTGHARVGGSALVSGDARVGHGASVDGRARVGDHARVEGRAHVTDDASVQERARVDGDASVYGRSTVRGHAHVTDLAHVHDSAVVYGEALVHGSAVVAGDTIVLGDARVGGDVSLWGPARIAGNADIRSREHLVLVAPVGPEGRTLTLYRTHDGHHRVSHETWTGTLDELLVAVDERWPAGNPWGGQLDALVELFRLRIASWPPPGTAEEPIVDVAALEFRTATPGDTLHVLGLCSQTWPDLLDDVAADLADHPDDFFVATHGRDVVAFLQHGVWRNWPLIGGMADHDPDAGDARELLWLAVDHDLHGRGVGGRLVDEWRATLPATVSYVVTSSAPVDDVEPDLERFYAANGFHLLPRANLRDEPYLLGWARPGSSLPGMR